MIRLCLLLALSCSWFTILAQESKITIDLSQPGATVSSTLHGIFFEEISHGGEGGLYAELIQNRGFEEIKVPEGCTLDSGWIVPPRTPHFGAHRVVDWKMPFEAKTDYPAWSLSNEGKASSTIAIDLDKPLYPETPRSLRVDIKIADAKNKVRVINEGFWGIRVDTGESYQLNFYARAEKYTGDITASLIGADGKILATKKFDHVGRDWKKYSATLKALSGDSKATFQLSFSQKGTVWLDFVSLFPQKTFRNRPNGMRPDLANYLADLKPAFVRWPGGCFVEGISVESAPNWKRSLGPVERRSGTYSPWGYWSSDGIGYYEFLQFCEDVGAKGMYVFNAGVACEMRSGVHVDESHVQPIIDDVLNAIEYAIGPKESKWGSLRAQHGHPEPFPLQYIEVGNEQVGVEYAKRFNRFYKAIKEKYPQLEILAAMGIAHLSQPTINAIEKMDFADEHAYKAAGWAMTYHDWYDQYKRNDWKLYVGEYACNAGVGNGNMTAALNDATFILGMERNSDIITMSSYAPLLENVNDTDWPVNLIRFDNAKSFARISYYAIKMLNENKATVNLKTNVDVPVIKDKPMFAGPIALSTWDTQSEYKDIQIVKDGKTIYQLPSTNQGEWKFEGGSWTYENGVIAQKIEGAWPMAYLSTTPPDAYTLKLKARKTGGYNAFMIPFAIEDGNNYLRAHIGAWVNRIAAFEMVIKGADAIVSQPVRLESPIELNRWYDIELRVGMTEVECYLDGKLLMKYTRPKSVFAIGGLDEKTNEVVIKVVNATANENPIRITLDHLGKFNPEATMISLSSPSSEAENAFENPQQFVPVTEKTKIVGADFVHPFKPWSLTVIRIKR